MIRGFVLGPWMTIIPFFLHTFIFLNYIWQKYTFAGILKRENKYFLSTKQRFSGWRAVYYVFGIYLIDSGIKMLFGILGFENWAFIFPSALIFLIVGLEYIFRAVFKAPNRYDLKVSFTVLFIALILLEIYLPRSADLMISIATLLIPFLIAWFLFGPVCRLRIRYLENLQRTSELFEVYEPIYDLTHGFYQIFTPLTDIIIWVVIFLDVVLRFEGFSPITIFLYSLLH